MELNVKQEPPADMSYEFIETAGEPSSSYVECKVSEPYKPIDGDYPVHQLQEDVNCSDEDMLFLLQEWGLEMLSESFAKNLIDVSLLDYIVDVDIVDLCKGFPMRYRIILRHKLEQKAYKREKRNQSQSPVVGQQQIVETPVVSQDVPVPMESCQELYRLIETPMPIPSTSSPAAVTMPASTSQKKYFTKTTLPEFPTRPAILRKRRPVLAPKNLEAPIVNKKRRHSYSEEALLSSLKAVESRLMTVYEAARYYGIPARTIRSRLDKIMNKTQLSSGPTLSAEEDKRLIEWLQKLDQRGFPCNIHAVQVKLKEFLHNNPHSTELKNEKPGDRWLMLFLRRHKQLTLWKQSNIVHVSEDEIRLWYRKMFRFLQKSQLIDILKDGRRVLNGDETVYLYDSRLEVITASMDDPYRWTVPDGSDSDNMTAFCIFDAGGFTYPPCLVLPLEQKTFQHFGTDWNIEKSSKGRLDKNSFVSYITNTVHPNLMKRKVPLPVILLIDGHRTPTGLQALEACAELGIMLIALYPKARHIMGNAKHLLGNPPIFMPLKQSWEECAECSDAEHLPPSITLDFFCGQLAEIAVTPSSAVQDGFRTCGLFPFDADAVKYKSCLPTCGYVSDNVNMSDELSD